MLEPVPVHGHSGQSGASGKTRPHSRDLMKYLVYIVMQPRDSGRDNDPLGGHEGAGSRSESFDGPYGWELGVPSP